MSGFCAAVRLPHPQGTLKGDFPPDFPPQAPVRDARRGLCCLYGIDQQDCALTLQELSLAVPGQLLMSSLSSHF